MPRKTKATVNDDILFATDARGNANAQIVPDVAMQILAPAADPYADLPEDVRSLIQKERETEIQPYRPVPPRLKIAPGGAGTFITQTREQFDELTGVIAVAAVTRGWFPGKEVSTLPPLCSSHGGSTGIFSDLDDEKQIQKGQNYPVPHRGIELLTYKDAEFPDYFHCNGCPMNRWGTDPGGGRGKACKEMRRMLFFVDGLNLPMIISLPPTSIGNWDQFCTGVEAQGYDYFLTHIRMTQTVVKGQYPHGVAEFESLGYVTDAAKIRSIIELRRAYDEYINAAPVEAVEYTGEESKKTPF